MSEAIGICAECGGEDYGNFSIHNVACKAYVAAKTKRATDANALLLPIRSDHRDAPDCDCIACALKRGEDRD